MSNELILIVDDSDKNRKLARMALEFHGYRTVEACTAEEAIVIARDRQPALILMDFRLPGMNGIEALIQLRADKDTLAIPVIAVTASAMSEDREKILAAGFEGLQTKPFKVNDFVRAVGETIERARAS